MHRWLPQSLMLGFFAFPGVFAHAAPQASAMPRTWELDFSFHDVQRISLTHAGDNRQTTYWYLLFTVTNNTGKDVEFFPSFRLVTDTFEVVEGGENISPSVYKAIFARHRPEYRFAEAPSRITGTLLQGEDNARTSAVVFRMFGSTANRFTVFVSGLSGDIARVPNPSFDARDRGSDGRNRGSSAGSTGAEKNARFFIVRRTLAISYDLPGDEESHGNATPIRRLREWVMR